MDTNRKNQEIMKTYLKEFYRYPLLNSWNGVYGYAIKVKVWDFNFNSKVQDFFLSAISTQEFYDILRYTINDKEMELRQKFNLRDSLSIGQNGRSGGYLVLYHLLSNDNSNQFWTDEEIDNMEYSELKDNYEILKCFAELKNDLKKVIEDLAKNYNIVDETIFVKKTEKRLKQKCEVE